MAKARLSGLDGIRGLAAAYVVVNHVFLRTFPGYPHDRAPFWAGWFIYGRFAVVVFIVLSGFSLALSAARNGWRLDAVSRFARRRARRILPAYFAALAFSLSMAWLLVPQPGEGLPNARSVLVNGLLVQNLVRAPSPNRAFWTLAVEAQLYVFFPLLLLLVRRLGAAAMVAVVALLVAAVGMAAPHERSLHTFVVQSAPDLAALFAIGIAAAGLVAVRRPWTRLAVLLGAPMIVAIWLAGSVWTLTHLLWVDLLLGPAVACLVLAVASGQARSLLRFLDSRPIRGLGLSSYSLYLLHEPIVAVLYRKVVEPHYHHGPTAFLVLAAIALPAAIAVAWLFASVFERPFLAGADRRQRQVEQVVAPSRLRLEIANVRRRHVHARPHL